MRVHLLIGLVACFGNLVIGGRAAATTAVTSFGAPQGEGHTFGNELIATSFTTGSVPAHLTSVSVNLANEQRMSQTYSAAIWSDSAGLPGAILETLPPQDVLGSLYQDVTFASTGLDLEPNTTYWFAVSSNGGSDAKTALPHTETSAYGWSIGVNNALAANPPETWIYERTFPPLRMQVDVVFIPEPASCVAGGLPLFLLRRRRGQ